MPEICIPFQPLTMTSSCFSFFFFFFSSRLASCFLAKTRTVGGEVWSRVSGLVKRFGWFCWSYKACLIIDKYFKFLFSYSTFSANSVVVPRFFFFLPHLLNYLFLFLSFTVVVVAAVVTAPVAVVVII